MLVANIKIWKKPLKHQRRLGLVSWKLSPLTPVLSRVCVAGKEVQPANHCATELLLGQDQCH